MLQAVQTTHIDWQHLEHAYGRATDTPKHLQALFAQDQPAINSAIGHLFGAIIHQGTPWTATAPATQVLINALRSPAAAVLSIDTYIALLKFFNELILVIEQGSAYIEDYQKMAAFDLTPLGLDTVAIYEHEEAANAIYARSILSCCELAVDLFKVLLQALDHHSETARVLAARGLSLLVKTPALSAQRAYVIERLTDLLQQAPSIRDQASYLLALGELDTMPLSYLKADSPSLRMCTALAPALRQDSAALNVLVDSLEHHLQQIDKDFSEYPPQFFMKPHFKVVERLIETQLPFEQMLKGALVIVEVASKYTVDYDWGPILAYAFKGQSGKVQTEAQYVYLQALVNKPELWDAYFVNASLWFEQAGLIYAREACEKLLDAFHAK